MEKSKGTWLPKVEVLIIFIFLFIFLIWSATRCSATRKKYAEEVAPVDAEAAAQDSLAALYAQLQEKKAKEEQESREAAKAAESPEVLDQPFVTPLYVILDNLNVRELPDTDSKILDRLKLHDAVQFLNETTDFEEEIDLGDYTVTDRWVKVKTARGKIGWAFGGGVHYYKTKRRTSSN